MVIVPTSKTNTQVSSDFDALPRIILQRLAAENVFSPDDWRRLSKRQRSSIFGITPAHVTLINRAAGVCS